VSDLFVEEKSIGSSIFEEVKSHSSLFEEKKSIFTDSLLKISAAFDEKVKLLTPKIIKNTVIEEKEIDFDKFLKYFNMLSNEQLEKVKGKDGESGKPGINGSNGKIIIQELDQNYLKDRITKIFDTLNIKSLQNGELTFEKFQEFFNNLSTEDLKKVRGPRGLKGKGGLALSGGPGPQGATGETGPAGVATTGLIEFQETGAVTGMTETKIFDFTNSTGASIFLDNISGESQARSEWVFLIDDVEKKRMRSSVSDHNIDEPMFSFEVTNTQNIKVKATHYEGTTVGYSTTLIYHA